MGIFSDYSSIIINSFLQLKEGDALSINTEETDFELAKTIADMAVRVTKTVAKIVITNEGKPSEVVDFDPYDPPVQPRALSMLHLKHVNEALNEEDVLDVLVDKDDLKAMQKLGHLADPIILDRRIVISWCVAPAYYADNPSFKELVDRLSGDLEAQILSAKYRKQFLNSTDIERFHLYGENCDFTVDFPSGTEFTGGPSVLNNGRQFISGPDFQRLMCNVDKNSLNGWISGTVKVFGKKYNVKLEFKEGKMIVVDGCKQFEKLLSFDGSLRKPGYISVNDKDFSLVFGSSLVESLSLKPESVDDLPEWFNDSIYKYELKLEDKLNIEFFGSDKTAHELVRKGFFLE